MPETRLQKRKASSNGNPEPARQRPRNIRQPRGRQGNSSRSAESSAGPESVEHQQQHGQQQHHGQQHQHGQQQQEQDQGQEQREQEQPQQPLPQQQEQSLPQQEEQPLPQQVEQPLPQQQEQPLPQQEDQPLLQQEEQPLPQQEDQPLLQQEEQPLPQQEEQPLPQQEDQPLLQQEEQPLPQQEDQPLLQQEEQPLPQQEEQQLPQQEDQPLPQQEQQPLPQQEERPLPQQQEEQPLPQQVEQPLPQQQDEQPLPQQQEGQPLPQQEEQPLPQQEEQPLPQREEQPLPQQEPQQQHQPQQAVASSHTHPRPLDQKDNGPAYVLEHGTSQSQSPRKAAALHRPSPSLTQTEPSTANSTTSETKDTSHCLQSEAVESALGLRLSSRPFVFDDIAVLPPALRPLVNIRNHEAIIPETAKDHFLCIATSTDTLASWMLDKFTSIDQTKAIDELDEMQMIVKESHYCQHKEASEAAWNDGVNSRVLSLALHPFSKLKHHNITSARPERCLIPENVRDEQLNSKLVDYSINLTFCSENPPSASPDDVIRTLLSQVPNTRQTMNQTRYGPVRFKPAAMSIQTKPGLLPGDLKKLSIWIASWMEQMRYLRRVVYKRRVEAGEKPDALIDAIKLPIPHIVVLGSIWKLYLAQDFVDKTVLSPLFSIGDTDSLVGVCRLVKSLRLLANWTDTEYRNYIRTEILGLPAAKSTERVEPGLASAAVG